MKHILRLRVAGKLSDAQVRAALLFHSGRSDFGLPPRFAAILREVVVGEKSLGAMEAARGWPSRSAKAIVSEILHLCAGTDCATDAMDQWDDEVERYVFDTMGQEIAGFCDRFALTAQEARLMAVLDRNRGRAVTYQSILAVLYPTGEEPDFAMRVVHQHLVRLRRKIAKDGLVVETITGFGLRLVDRGATDRAAVARGGAAG